MVEAAALCMGMSLNRYRTMACKWLLAIIVIVNKSSAQDSKARIVAAPASRVATFNSDAVFSCNGTGSVLFWKIDGLKEDNPVNVDRGIDADTLPGSVDGTRYSTLTVPGTLENNETVIQCVVLGLGSDGHEESPNVTLLIQGILAPPSNLAIGHVSDYNQRLTWTPPFTLDITDVEPDITYSVCCNVTTNCTSTTNPYYDFPTLCDPVEFTVTAVNPVGDSEPSSIIFDPIYAQRPTNLMVIGKPEVSFLSVTQPVVDFLIQPNGNCTGMYEAEFKGTYTPVIMFNPMIPTVGKENGFHFLTYSVDIKPNDIYNGEIKGSMGGIVKADFTTYDVQHQEVNNHGGVINVTCIFAKGSQAQGCFITISQLLLEANYTNVWDSEAFRDSDQNATASFVGLPAGNYSLLIQDIEENGTIDRYFTPHFSIFSITHDVMTTFVLITLAPTAIGTPSVSITTTMGLPFILAGVTIAVLLVAIASIVITCAPVILYRRHRRGRGTCTDNKAVESQQQKVTFPMRQNLCYEDSQALRVTRGPQPTDIEECPAYGVLNRHQ